MSKPKTLSARHAARCLALQGLYAWFLTGNVVRDIIADLKNSALQTGSLPLMEMEELNILNVDLDYFEELMLKVTASTKELEAVMLPFLNRSLESLTAIERAILLIGVYELSFRQDIPFRVVLNEAIDLAKQFGATDSHKFVNGVLDKVAKAKSLT